jgi:hypothetical protein
VDESTQIGRTREAIVGIQHELIPNLAIGVDYVYRKFDNGTANYTIGYEPGAANFPISSLYTGPQFYTDPSTGITAPYYVVCPTCTRPSGVGNITMTRLSYEEYNGVVLTANKRFSNRWQLNSSITIQDNPGFTPLNSLTGGNPTGVEFGDGVSTLEKYLFKLSGSYALPWHVTASANLNINHGATRAMTINGPGAVPGSGGLTSTGAAAGNLTYNTLAYQPGDTVRLAPSRILDFGVHKTFAFSGGKYRVKVMGDAFNVTNSARVGGYVSNNVSLATAALVNNILPPRVFRVGAQVFF